MSDYTINETIIFCWALMSIEVNIIPKTMSLLFLIITMKKTNLWIGLARGKLFRWNSCASTNMSPRALYIGVVSSNFDEK